MKNEATAQTNAAGAQPRCASLFSQMLNLIDRREFDAAVARTGAERRSKGFSCWDQFVAMCFCQLAQAKSLREITQGLASCEGRLRHLGLTEAPARSTLSYANQVRPAALYEEVFQQVLARCQATSPGHKFRFKNKLLSLDSTVLELCASMFDWARFRQTKGAVKLHLLLDHGNATRDLGVVDTGLGVEGIPGEEKRSAYRPLSRGAYGRLNGTLTGSLGCLDHHTLGRHVGDVLPGRGCERHRLEVAGGTGCLGSAG
jgi:hypothetical protein